MITRTSQDDGKGDPSVEVVLHDKVLLADQEGADRGQGHVRARHAGLAVEGLKPLLGENAHPHGGLFDGACPEKGRF